MPKVSVILTSYNHAQFIGEAIQSVLDQTERDFELIIWDDASTDNSWEIISEFKDKRILAFRNNRQMRGVWGLNQAISKIVSAPFIAIHHSDDVWLPNKLDVQLHY